MVESVEVTFHYPAYLGRKDETISQKGLDLEAPQYTRGRIAVAALGARWPRAIWIRTASDSPGRVEDDGKLLVASMPLLEERHV